MLSIMRNSENDNHDACDGSIQNCSQRSKINKLIDKVLDGNGRPPLITRMEQQETLSAELSKIVKGESEGEGLQYHVTQMMAWKRLLQWEMHFILAGIVAICAVLALKH